MASLRTVAMFAVLLFSLLSILLFIQHELHSMNKDVLEKDGIPVGFSSGLRAIRESANAFLHHKIGTNDYSEDVEDKEDKEDKDPIKKGPAVDTVDSNMGASGKDTITGNFRGKDRNKKQEDEIEKVDVSKGKKPKKEKGEQDDNAKEDDDKVDEPGSKSKTKIKTKTDGNEEEGVEKTV